MTKCIFYDSLALCSSAVKKLQLFHSIFTTFNNPKNSLSFHMEILPIFIRKIQNFSPNFCELKLYNFQFFVSNFYKFSICSLFFYLLYRWWFPFYHTSLFFISATVILTFLIYLEKLKYSCYVLAQSTISHFFLHFSYNVCTDATDSAVEDFPFPLTHQ